MDRKVINQSLVLDHNYVSSVVKAVLHTILFHRYFGNITPRDNHILSAVTYASVDDVDVINTVDEKVQELMQTLSPTSNSKSQISLYFTETKARKAWFSKSEEEVCWEEWAIYVQSKVGAQSEKERTERHSSAVDQCKKAIFNAIQEIDKNKDHIPLIATSQANPFPYHITVAPASGLWSSMIKRAILPGIS